jgi:hypothetical protein
MKIVMWIAGLLVLLLGGVSVAALTQPDHLHVERQIDIQAKPVDMDPFANDVKKINSWSPWNELDPNLKQEFSDPTSGVGAWYSWEGNDEVGSGKATITTAEPGKVVTGLEFYAPMEGVADATVTYARKGKTMTVVWSLDQDMGFVDKVFSLFMDFDKMIGDAYSKGLGMLKPMVEKAAALRIAEEKRAAAEVEKKRLAEDAAAAPESEEEKAGEGSEASPDSP